jgi:NADH dehydrogenase
LRLDGTVGRRRAAAEYSGLKFTGMPAYLMRGFIHVTYLIGWGNRLGTIYTWARAEEPRPSHHQFQTSGYEVAGQRTLFRSVQPYTDPPPRPDPDGTAATIPEQPRASR